uniref:Uncharacterized protein n=1 Tax=Ascaris lumbricoides TaxID=6252 RepID=A0A9J2PJD8_ASCLU
MRDGTSYAIIRPYGCGYLGWLFYRLAVLSISHG